MNRRLITILSLAFLVAVLCSYVVYRIAAKQMSAPRGAQLTAVVVAARDLEIGTLIKDGDLSTADWTGPMPKGALTAKAAIVGRGVVSQLYQGEPIIESRLAGTGAGAGLAATIPPGMRACAVRVNEVVGVAGFVVPGTHVDVIISGTGPGASAAQGPIVKTLLQNIQVLSAGTNIQKDNEGKPVQVQVVNLLVNPAQAEVLSLAGNETKIQLVLRNPLDTDTTATPGAAMSGLFADRTAPRIEKVVARSTPAPKVEKVEKAPEQVYLVQVLNGSKHSEEKFKAPEGESRQVSQ